MVVAAAEGMADGGGAGGINTEQAKFNQIRDSLFFNPLGQVLIPPAFEVVPSPPSRLGFNSSSPSHGGEG